MSIFLRSLVRSEAKSCSGKNKFPREDSAARSAVTMMQKKKARFGTDEVFSHYQCDFCKNDDGTPGWHIGHQTSFDWIPVSHVAYTLLVNQYNCCGCSELFYTNTCISNRILLHYPAIKDAPEVGGVVCTKCRHLSEFHIQLERRFIELKDVPLDSTESVETLWKKVDRKMKYQVKLRLTGDVTLETDDLGAAKLDAAQRANWNFATDVFETETGFLVHTATAYRDTFRPGEPATLGVRIVDGTSVFVLDEGCPLCAEG